MRTTRLKVIIEFQRQTQDKIPYDTTTIYHHNNNNCNHCNSNNSKMISSLESESKMQSNQATRSQTGYSETPRTTIIAARALETIEATIQWCEFSKTNGIIVKANPGQRHLLRNSNCYYNNSCSHLHSHNKLTTRITPTPAGQLFLQSLQMEEEITRNRQSLILCRLSTF